jgi:SAM-dependent methyltransferase
MHSPKTQARPAGLTCPICQNTMVNKTSAFTYICKPCNYWGADLPVDIDAAGTDEYEISDEAYIASLEGLRIKNFGLILQQLKQQKPKATLSILDVGCASGLFMQLAQKQGYKITGIEPNQQLYKITQKHGLKVIHDYFPPKEYLGEQFDVITFNDVFEHIPDIHTILNSCADYLKEDGVLILNLPNAQGLIFRFSKILARLGMLGPWNRLWQVMFRTPHLHYFSFSSLNTLVSQHGFTPTEGKQEIATIEMTGLWSRLSVNRSASALLKNSVLYLGTLALYPFILFAEKDTFFVIYQRQKIKT